MRRLLPVVTAALVLLVGCSADDDPEPRIAPTDSSSAASTTAPPPSPTGPVEPTLPAEAVGEDAAAAEAFVRFYWEMVNYAQATGDTDGLATLEAANCRACVGGRESIELTYRNGGSIAGGVSEVLSAESTRLAVTSGKAFRVVASVKSTPQIVRIPGEKESRNEGGEYDFDFIVQFVDGWKVARWDVDL